MVHLPCCGLPLVLGLLGASTGAAEVFLHGPLRWAIVAVSLVMSGVSLWLVFRKRKRACACDANACVHEKPAHWLPKAVVVVLTLSSLAMLLWPDRHDHADHAGHAHTHQAH